MPKFAARLVALTVALIAPPVLTGCGSKDAATNPGDQGPSAQQALEDLRDLLKTAASEKKRPPAKLADLETYEGPHLAATLAVQQKKVVYVWGAGLGSGAAVVAYEPTAETAGGWVLLQSGEVKKLTADEFKAAPKAK